MSAAMQKALLQFILISIGFMTVASSNNMYWFEWNVAISNIEGTIRPEQVKINRQPWLTKPNGSWDQFTMRSGISVLSDKGNLYGCNANFITVRSSRDQQIEQIASGIIGIPMLFLLLLVLIYGLHWLFSTSYIYKKDPGIGLLVTFATLGYCLLSLALLALLGPAVSNDPFWISLPTDSSCAGTTTLQANLTGLRVGAIVFLGGFALILIVLGLHPYWWIISKRSQISITSN